MLELVNLSNASFDTENLLQGDGKKLQILLEQYRLDGIELMLCEPWDPVLHPAKDIQGVHLRFWPNWLDFWRGDQAALLQEFGSEAAWRQAYGNSREAWLEGYRENIRAAVRCGANYVVFHAAQARTSEIYTRQYDVTDEEVIEAALEMVNQVIDVLPESCRFLYENLWWPGLTFCQPELVQRLLDGTDHQNTGFMLDTGHLMNTNLLLRNEAQAVDYVLKTIENLGEMKQKVYGLHLHRSLSGEFVQKIMQAYRGKEKKSLDWQQTFSYIARTDQHEPFQTDAVRKLIEEIRPEYLVHEFIQDSYADWQRKLEIQYKALGKA